MLYPAYWPDHTFFIATIGVSTSLILYIYILTSDRFSLALKAISVFILTGLFCVLAPFTTTGYEITPDKLIIHRLGFTHTVKRADIVRVQVQPYAMANSRRIWRIADILRLRAYFKTEQLGAFQAYLSFPKNTVIIFGQDFVYVVSPQAAQSFARDLQLPNWRS
jgi:hypothetical protein